MFERPLQFPNVYLFIYLFPQAGLEFGTARSAGHRSVTELPGLLFGETEDGSI